MDVFSEGVIVGTGWEHHGGKTDSFIKSSGRRNTQRTVGHFDECSGGRDLALCKGDAVGHTIICPTILWIFGDGDAVDFDRDTRRISRSTQEEL